MQCNPLMLKTKKRVKVLYARYIGWLLDWIELLYPTSHEEV